MTTPVYILGIDLSKARLDCATLPDGQSLQFANSPAGFAAIIELLAGQRAQGWEVLAVVEATGGYERTLIEALCAAGLPSRGPVTAPLASDGEHHFRRGAPGQARSRPAAVARRARLDAGRPVGNHHYRIKGHRAIVCPSITPNLNTVALQKCYVGARKFNSSNFSQKGCERCRKVRHDKKVMSKRMAAKSCSIC